MLKSILKEGSLYSLVDIFTRGLSFLLLPLYTRVLSPEDYGIIDLMTITGTLAVYVVGLEVAQATVRFVPSMVSITGKKIFLSTTFWYYLFSLGVLLVVVSFFRDSLADVILDSPSRAILFQFGSIAFILNSLYFFLQNMLRIDRKVKLSIMINVLYISIATILAVYLIVIRQIGVIGNFYAIIGGAVAGIVAFVASTAYLSFSFDWTVLKKILRFSVPLVPASIATYFTFYVDRLFIKSFLSMDDLGIYGVALRFASITTVLIGGFVTAMSPIVFERFAEKETPQHLARVLHFFLVATVIFVICLSTFSKELVMIFTGPDYYRAFQFIPILSLNIVIYNLYVFMPGLSIAKKTQIIAGIVIFSGLLNIGLNYLLILQFKTWGSILATTVSSVLSQSITFYFSNRYYPLPVNVTRLGLLLGLGIAASVLLPLADLWKGFNFDWTWMGVKFLILLGAGFVFVKVLRDLQSEIFPGSGSKPGTS